jgi:Flp pilus assembly protein TadG
MLVSRHLKRRRGAAVVEFAVTFAFFLLPVLLGLWEMSRLVEAKQVAQNACREAARQAATGTKSVAEVQATFLNYLARNNVSTSGVNVTFLNVTNGGQPDPRLADQSDRLRVSATVPYQNLNTATGISQLLGVTSLQVSADWCSMRDYPFSVDPNIPVE